MWTASYVLSVTIYNCCNISESKNFTMDGIRTAFDVKTPKSTYG